MTTCPLCHTVHPGLSDALDAGVVFRCDRCGQQWDAPRLKAVAAYDAWTAARARAAESVEPAGARA
jgi:hypothetical protein